MFYNFTFILTILISGHTELQTLRVIRCNPTAMGAEGMLHGWKLLARIGKQIQMLMVKPGLVSSRNCVHQTVVFGNLMWRVHDHSQ